MQNNARKIFFLALLWIVAAVLTAGAMFPESLLAQRLRSISPLLAPILDDDPRQAEARNRGMRVLYQFLDERGNAQIVEKLEDVPPEKRANVGFFEVPLQSVEESAQASRDAEPPKIIVYTTSWCGYCERLRNDLRRAQIPFEERDIEQNDTFAEEYRKLGVRGVPATLVGGKLVPGYQPQRIKQLYTK